MAENSDINNKNCHNTWLAFRFAMVTGVIILTVIFIFVIILRNYFSNNLWKEALNIGKITTLTIAPIAEKAVYSKQYEQLQNTINHLIENKIIQNTHLIHIAIFSHQTRTYLFHTQKKLVGQQVEPFLINKAQKQIQQLDHQQIMLNINGIKTPVLQYFYNINFKNNDQKQIITTLQIIYNKRLIQQPYFIFSKKLIIIGGTMTIVGVFISFLFSLFFLQPLKKLYLAIQAVVKGDYNIQLNGHYYDQIGGTAEALKKIIKHIQRVKLKNAELINQQIKVKIPGNQPLLNVSIILCKLNGISDNDFFKELEKCSHQPYQAKESLAVDNYFWVLFEDPESTDKAIYTAQMIQGLNLKEGSITILIHTFTIHFNEVITIFEKIKSKNYDESTKKLIQLINNLFNQEILLTEEALKSTKKTYQTISIKQEQGESLHLIKDTIYKEKNDPNKTNKTINNSEIEVDISDILLDIENNNINKTILKQKTLPPSKSSSDDLSIMLEETISN